MFLKKVIFGTEPINLMFIISDHKTSRVDLYVLLLSAILVFVFVGHCKYRACLNTSDSAWACSQLLSVLL